MNGCWVDQSAMPLEPHRERRVSGRPPRGRAGASATRRRCTVTATTTARRRDGRPGRRAASTAHVQSLCGLVAAALRHAGLGVAGDHVPDRPPASAARPPAPGRSAALPSARRARAAARPGSLVEHRVVGQRDQVGAEVVDVDRVLPAVASRAKRSARPASPSTPPRAASARTKRARTWPAGITWIGRSHAAGGQRRGAGSRPPSSGRGRGRGAASQPSGSSSRCQVS